MTVTFSVSVYDGRPCSHLNNIIKRSQS